MKVAVPKKEQQPPAVSVTGDTAGVRTEAAWQDYRDPFFSWRSM